MTRINTINPVFLLDQHLTREYQEITRISTWSRPYTPKDRVPKTYVLVICFSFTIRENSCDVDARLFMQNVFVEGFP